MALLSGLIILMGLHHSSALIFQTIAAWLSGAKIMPDAPPGERPEFARLVCLK